MIGVTAVILLALFYLLVLSRIRPDAAINGATAWINLGPFSIQPAEFAKLLIVLYLANMLSKREKNLSEHWRDNVRLIFRARHFSGRHYRLCIGTTRYWWGGYSRNYSIGIIICQWDFLLVGNFNHQRNLSGDYCGHCWLKSFEFNNRCQLSV